MTEQNERHHDPRQPLPAAGEHMPEPVHVHIASADVPLVTPAAAPAPRRRIRTRFLTETVDATNPVRPLLPESDDRVIAQLQVTGGDIYLCDSEHAAIQAVGTAASEQGAILPSANAGPWPISGGAAIWAAQVSTATSASVISVTADYRIPG